MAYTSSAVGRTFAVVELLEHILLETAELAAKDNYYFNKRLEPMQTLSALQRVSRIFRETITGSSKIQEIALRVPPTLSCPMSPAIYWLLYTQLKIIVTEKSSPESDDDATTGQLGLPFHETQEAKTLQIFGLRATDQAATQGKLVKFRKEKGSAEASWRRVKVQSQESDFRICCVDVEFRIAECLGQYDQDMTCDAETALGELFDQYCEIATRTRNEHFVAAEDSMTIRRRGAEY